MRETEQCEQKKEKKRKEKEKNVFSSRRPLRRNVVGEISLPTPLLSSLPPRWVYIEWVEMWDANGAIEPTVVDEFIERVMQSS